MDVDSTRDGDGFDEESSDTDSDDEDIYDSSDVAMVPMADLLNARYDSENVSHVGMNTSVLFFFALVSFMQLFTG